MVSVAQLVELRIVIPAVVGSSPIVHPIFRCFLYKDIELGSAELINAPLAVRLRNCDR